MVNGANVVFMSVGDDDAHDLFSFLAQVFIIGNDVIDPEHVIAREHNTRVNDHDLVVVLIGSHVLAYFPKSTQGNDLQFSVLTHTSMFSSLDFKNVFIRQWRLRSYR